MPTTKRVLVQLSRRHAWNLRGEYFIAPARYVPGGGESLPGWVVVCTTTSCSCSRGRPPHLIGIMVTKIRRRRQTETAGQELVPAGFAQCRPGWRVARCVRACTPPNVVRSVTQCRANCAILADLTVHSHPVEFATTKSSEVESRFSWIIQVHA